MKYSSKRKIYIFFSAAATGALMLLIFMLSAQTAADSSQTSGYFIALIFDFMGKLFTQDQIRTFAHFCEYACFGFLVCNLCNAVLFKIKPIICILLSWLYAWSDEIHQIFVDGRAFQLVDLAVDLGGIILGTGFFALFFYLNALRAPKSQSAN